MKTDAYDTTILGFSGETLEKTQKNSLNLKNNLKLYQINNFDKILQLLAKIQCSALKLDFTLSLTPKFLSYKPKSSNLIRKLIFFS
jgi:hypothetical protein